jgi:hypothetical protein
VVLLSGRRRRRSEHRRYRGTSYISPSLKTDRSAPGVSERRLSCVHASRLLSHSTGLLLSVLVLDGDRVAVGMYYARMQP